MWLILVFVDVNKQTNKKTSNQNKIMLLFPVALMLHQPIDIFILYIYFFSFCCGNVTYTCTYDYLFDATTTSTTERMVTMTTTNNFIVVVVFIIITSTPVLRHYC